MTCYPDPMTIDPPDAREWRVVGTRTTESRIAIASVTAETTVYEHAPTASALEGLDVGPAIPLRSVLTVDLSFSPPLESIGIGPESALGMAAPKAIEQFRDVVASEGIEIGDERESTGFERADGTAGRRAIFAVEYPTGTPESDGGDGTTVDAELHVAVWPTESSYAMAGGLVPLEAPETTELELAPESGRERLCEVIETVDLEDER